MFFRGIGFFCAPFVVDPDQVLAPEHAVDPDQVDPGVEPELVPGVEHQGQREGEHPAQREEEPVVLPVVVRRPVRVPVRPRLVPVVLPVLVRRPVPGCGLFVVFVSM